MYMILLYSVKNVAKYFERSAIRRNLEQKHNLATNTLDLNLFSILKKCQSELDCLIYGMFFIRELKPDLLTLNPTLSVQNISRRTMRS